MGSCALAKPLEIVELIDFDKNSQIYLFGSRVDDSKKGGDIDILIVSDKITRANKREIKLDFYEKFGEQKLDILVDDGSFVEPFSKIALKGGVEL